MPPRPRGPTYAPAVIGTYASALIVCGTALLAGQAILVACGQRRASVLAPVIGLGPVLAISWGAVQLPGEGATALAVVLAVALLSAIVAGAGRVQGAGAAAREALPAAALTLLAASIPFAVEGRFGVLGTGFNVDMSQHLFVADWLADPSGVVPGLVDQGYPLGPHSLAVVAAQLDGGNVVYGFDGLTIAIPVVAAVSSLVVLKHLPPMRRAFAATLVGLPYLFASYLAQGQFKELLQGLFVLGFALALYEISAGKRSGRRLLAAVPLAAIAIGSLYAYSAPGLAWLAGAAALFALAELYRRRAGGATAVIRSVAAPVAVGLAVVLVAAAPELGRIADFRSNATNVAGGSANSAPAAKSSSGEAGQRGDGGGREPHDNDLGNLFDQISPAEVFGIWPSGDFRVDPGGGGVPAAVFYLGVLLGAVAFGLALLRWLRRGEPAVPAALVAAVAIYLAALALATPYTAAKALMMVAPLLMLVTVRGMLATDALALAPRTPRAAVLALVAAAFAVAAAGSSLLVLAKAPVGPTEYAPGLAEMRPIFKREPTLVLADPTALANEHGREFLDWEARGGDPVCIEPTPSASGGPPPAGIRFVVTTQGDLEPPFSGLSEVEVDEPYALWERRGGLGGRPPSGEPGAPSECGLAIGG